MSVEITAETFLPLALSGSGTFEDFAARVEQLAKRLWKKRWERALEDLGVNSTGVLLNAWQSGVEGRGESTGKPYVALRTDVLLTFWNRSPLCHYCQQPIRPERSCRWIETTAALVLAHDECYWLNKQLREEEVS